jgi:hypothetical protein
MMLTPASAAPNIGWRAKWREAPIKRTRLFAIRSRHSSGFRADAPRFAAMNRLRLETMLPQENRHDP